jgi:hypothetical protein
MVQYDKSQYYVDFSNHENLTNDEKNALDRIQQQYRPIERVEFLIDYRATGKITADEFETMTGLPYSFDN